MGEAKGWVAVCDHKGTGSYVAFLLHAHALMGRASVNTEISLEGHIYFCFHGIIPLP